MRKLILAAAAVALATPAFAADITVAVTAIEPVTVAPLAGAVSVTVGAVVSASTSTAASFDAGLMLPATSCAVTT